LGLGRVKTRMRRDGLEKDSAVTGSRVPSRELLAPGASGRLQANTSKAGLSDLRAGFCDCLPYLTKDVHAGLSGVGLELDPNDF
jgi:hypothetical protein